MVIMDSSNKATITYFVLHEEVVRSYGLSLKEFKLAFYLY